MINMEYKDIFISYRRQDAEAHAYMLYKDLNAAGYSVFYDHKSLGSGNFVEAIKQQITNCKDVIVILSKEALGKKIFSETDVMRQEIAYAIKNNKRVVGIMLSGFEDFPEELPEDIEPLRYINCLYSKMEYYDAMFERLTSGMFLISSPQKNSQPVVIKKTDKNEILDEFKKQPVETKYNYMKLLLELAHEFNSSPECMRLYQYLDLYDRNKGVKQIEPYHGNIPTDYTTYLSFFETLYLILYTETLDMALVDEMYRFRFFAMCNNPIIQKSELLPLGYQYPNILQLYDMWSEHVRRNFQGSDPDESFAESIPLYENDLHKMYLIYKFALNPTKPRNIRFINNQGERLDLVLRRITKEEYSLFSEFQTKVLSGIENNEEENVFEPLTDEEIHEAVENSCFGLFDGDEIVALLSVIPNPKDERNLVLDLDDVEDKKDVLIVDCILVDERYRGYNMQRVFLQLSEFIAKKMGISLLCAVVSPKNYYSIRNFIKAGYLLAATKPKYHSIRDFFIKRIDIE